jgi:hypothetical protein
VIRIGVLTPHAAIGPEEEFPAMAPARLATDVVRIATEAGLVSAGSGASFEISGFGQLFAHEPAIGDAP